MNWFLIALKKYAVFSGRANRPEYWYFTLFYMLLLIVLMVVEMAIGIPGVLSLVGSLALLLPSLAVSVRRLHDVGKSGWWMLIALVPLIGAIVLLIFFVKKGEAGENRFGPATA